MELHVNSWGNSLGVRLPKMLAEMLGVTKGSSVEATMQGNKLILSPIKKISKAKPDKEFSDSVSATLDEWNSTEDDHAFRNL